jgi:hypothetical protein
MPSTATPPPPPPPPAVSYPPPPPPAAVGTPAAPPVGGHGHLNGAKIGAIAGGGVAVIGGIVALITLLGHHNPPKPPPAPAPVQPAQPVNNQPTTPPSQPTQPTSPPSEPASPAPASPTPESSQPAEPSSNQGGSTYDLGNGATLTPVAGWKVEGTGNHQVALLSPNSDAEYFAIGGAAKEQDAASQLQADAQSYVSSDSALSNVKVAAPQTQSVGGSAGFTQVATMPFTATLTTNQGTTQIIGLFYDLYNTQGYSVLAVFDATSQDAYQAAAKDSDAMTSSILGGSG